MFRLWLMPVMPFMVPAWQKKQFASRDMGAQEYCARLSRGRVRKKCTPHSCRGLSGKRMLRKGIAISAVHPNSVNCPPEYQTAS